ncbi:ATP-dependent helicase [Anaeromyxobacter dehalogenans]|uniref:DNA 3'-5' helicase II n=1 Tax=Anaeromyxobacter dehalogenans (strain 2CP-C) TaxID=290397 RepID=Q2IEH9_ANADE|nr:ATP-dependent helicase [Anaeromyxobacter dehalogenans]ABC82991.1 UvrD/REP helicase [Anaeromyxobacter dehalogenans 2CP-C]
MTFAALTAEQEAVVLSDKTVFVTACPGAGKTRVIVEAFLREGGRAQAAHGVLVLSFSRCAADEIRKRCVREGRASAFEYPHFVDTFDAFVSRFLVAPFRNRWCPGRPVTYLDSWDRLGVKVHLRLKNAPPPIPLSAFELKDVDAVALQPRNVEYAFRKAAAQHLDALNAEANALRGKLLARGYMTCADGRALALSRVREARGQPVLKAIAARFPVAIVDEVQDCNSADLEILERLMAAGVRTLAVGDPNQDIYRFRGADGRRAARLFVSASQLSLTGNHRSTENICRFASSVKLAAGSDTAVGRYGAEVSPVVVLGYEPPLDAGLGDAFVVRLRALRISAEDGAVLAYQEADALAAVGRTKDAGASRVAKLASAIEVFRSAAPRPADLLAATEHAESLLLAKHGLKCSSALPKEVAQRNGIDSVALRTEALRILCSLAKESIGIGDASWLERARCALDRADMLLPTGTTCASGQVLKKAGKEWRVPEAPCEFRGTATTVHAAKGREYPGVMVVLPPGKRTKQLLDEWETRQDSEGRAVLYVAATRAQRLLVLAAPNEYASRVYSLASRDGAHCVLDPIARQGVEEAVLVEA